MRNHHSSFSILKLVGETSETYLGLCGQLFKSLCFSFIVFTGKVVQVKWRGKEMSYTENVTDVDKYNENVVISSDIFLSAIILFDLDFITDPNSKLISRIPLPLVGFSYVYIQGLVDIPEIF
jgi:hypothetical protein